VDYVGIGEGEGDEIVDVSGETSKACFVAHEAVDVDKEQAATASVVGGGVWDEGLGGRGTGVLRRHGHDG
jgi:hypothetical protein